MGPSKAEPELSTSNLVSSFVEFIQPPICWVKFTKEENLSIKKRCKEIYGKSQTATISNTLAGNISRQHKASDDLYGFFLKKCTGIADEILSAFPRKREWRMTSCWVNYKKKHEFTGYISPMKLRKRCSWISSRGQITLPLPPSP